MPDTHVLPYRFVHFIFKSLLQWIACQRVFVFLKNTGNMHFEPWSLEGAIKGRWLTMDAGDLDGDGKIDIVLGNFIIAPSMMTSAVDWRKGPPFLLLKNVGK